MYYLKLGNKVFHTFCVILLRLAPMSGKELVCSKKSLPVKFDICQEIFLNQIMYHFIIFCLHMRSKKGRNYDSLLG